MKEADAIKEVVEEMEDEGYEVTPKQVKDLLEHHRSNPMPDNAALASNILAGLQVRGIKV